MIEHSIEHEVVAPLFLPDIRPRSQLGVHMSEIDHCKAPVRGVREKGKDVNGVDGPPVIGVDEMVKNGQGGVPFSFHDVSVGYKNHVLFREAFLG